ncbi:MAG: hypothetical protein QXU35_04865 [Zestosphaera sp.]
MSLNKLVRKLRRYVGGHVEVTYYNVKYPKIVSGMLKEVNNEYLTVEEFGCEVVIRLPWVVSVTQPKYEVVAYEEEDFDESVEDVDEVS